MRFIGDVHGKYDRYKKLIKSAPESVQVGDMGVGFYRPDMTRCTNPPYDTMLRNNAEFIRGNHDNPSACKTHSQWISDGSTRTIGSSKVMFVGGAKSIDIGRRIEGLTWWKDEELSHIEFNSIVETYLKYKPDVMITHDCPEQVAALLNDSFKLEFPSITRQALEVMFEFHKPSLHIFGHWHHSFRMNIYGTEFICLAELEHLDVDL